MFLSSRFFRRLADGFWFEFQSASASKIGGYFRLTLTSIFLTGRCLLVISVFAVFLCK